MDDGLLNRIQNLWITKGVRLSWRVPIIAGAAAFIGPFMPLAVLIEWVAG